jgi:hypothetical protein
VNQKLLTTNKAFLHFQNTMPVPRRRRSKGVVSLAKLPGQAMSLLDINFIFQKTKPLLYWGFAPTVVLLGLSIDPKPSWLDLINIWD